MELTFNTRGNEKQKECVKAWVNPEITEIIYGGSKGSSKSYTGCSLIFGDALMYPGTHYFIARNTLKDIRAFTIPSIYEVFEHWGLDKELYLKFNGQDSYFTLPNESRVYLLDAKYLPSDPHYERFGSMQFTRGWIEEGGEFALECKQNLQASVGRKKNKDYDLVPKLLITCNPSRNFLYDIYKKNKENKLPSHIIFIQAYPQDNKMLGQQYIDNLEKTLTGVQRERLLLGNWEYDDDPSLLCDYDAICDLFTNDHVLTGKKYISADLAMQGRDKFVAGYWEGMVCNVAIDKGKSTAREIELDLKEIKTIQGVGNSSIVADSDGLGAYLEAYISNIKTFHGGAKPTKRKVYNNLKSQCGFKLAEKINNREIYIKCTPQQEEEIKKELSTCLKRDNVDIDKKALIKKEKMKELLGNSPDYLDMLLMRMWFEVKYRVPKSSRR